MDLDRGETPGKLIRSFYRKFVLRPKKLDRDYLLKLNRSLNAQYKDNFKSLKNKLLNKKNLDECYQHLSNIFICIDLNNYVTQISSSSERIIK